MVDLKRIVNSLKKSTQKKKGYENISLGSDIPGIDEFDFVSTGNLAFDLIADGGIPFGYLTELLGLSQSGKSTIIYKTIANAQEEYDAVGILVDREDAYTKERGSQLGVNNENLLICPPKDAVLIPNAFDFIMDTITAIRKSDDDENQTHIVIAVDSIGSFDQDTELSKSSTPRKAKDLHAAFRKILPYMDKRIMFMAANHKTYQVGIIYGDNTTSTGGEAMKYYNNVRFALQDRKKIVDAKRGNEVMGNWIGIESIKTRLGPCYRTAYVRHLYKTGIDYYSGYARLLAQRGYLTPKNKQEFNSFKQSTVKYDGKEFSENNIEKFLQEHPELLFDKYPEYNDGSVEKKEKNE